MDSIRLRNIRSLADTGFISLKPITLLLGQNSSGKSTVLRTLPLLLQSIRTRSNAPILWYGDLVDFGSVREVRSTFASAEEVQFELRLGKVDISRRAYAFDDTPEDSSPDVSLSIGLVDADGKTRLKSFFIKADDDQLTVELDARGAIVSLSVNDIDYTKLFPSDRFRFTNNDIVPQLLATGRTPSPARGLMFYNQHGRLIDTCEKEIRRFFSDRLSKRVSDETVTGMIRRIPYRPGTAFVKALWEATSQLVSGKTLYRSLVSDSGNRDLDRLRGLFFAGHLSEILSSVERAVTRFIGNVSYVGPSRATGERYYRLQELAVDQIDPQGKNLAMFLHSLTQFQQKQFSEWLLEAMGYEIQIEKSAGHIQIQLREEGSNRYYNLADMGYGFSQVLPIMAQVWSRQTRNSSGRYGPVFVAMEQPELHLHPAYQAKLAGVFCRSIKGNNNSGRSNVDLRFVIETHSEALVNELGNLVYEGKITPEDIAIYVFEKSSEGSVTEIRSVTFDEEGTLNNWPIGFFSAHP